MQMCYTAIGWWIYSSKKCCLFTRRRLEQSINISNLFLCNEVLLFGFVWYEHFEKINIAQQHGTLITRTFWSCVYSTILQIAGIAKLSADPGIQYKQMLSYWGLVCSVIFSQMVSRLQLGRTEMPEVDVSSEERGETWIKHGFYSVFSHESLFSYTFVFLSSVPTLIFPAEGTSGSQLFRHVSSWAWRTSRWILWLG